MSPPTFPGGLSAASPSRTMFGAAPHARPSSRSARVSRPAPGSVPPFERDRASPSGSDHAPAEPVAPTDAAGPASGAAIRIGPTAGSPAPTLISRRRRPGRPRPPNPFVCAADPRAVSHEPGTLDRTPAPLLRRPTPRPRAEGRSHDRTPLAAHFARTVSGVAPPRAPTRGDAQNDAPLPPDTGWIGRHGHRRSCRARCLAPPRSLTLRPPTSESRVSPMDSARRARPIRRFPRAIAPGQGSQPTYVESA